MEESQKLGKCLSSNGTESNILDSKELRHKIIEFINIPEVTQLKEALGNRADLHLVGGTIRDLARNKKNYDLDFASNLRPEEIQKLIEVHTDFKVVPTGIEHGTITVVTPNFNFEITTFRKPGTRLSQNYSDNILEDLAGRDFTFNALAFSFNNLELYDPYHGLNDLNENIIKAVEDPEVRFLEDPLRLLRLVRIGVAQGFNIENATYQVAKKLPSKINEVSIERVRSELEKILVSKHVAESFRVLLDIGVLNYILPELVACVGVEQNDFHIHDVFDHTLWVLERSKPDLTLRLACLFHDLGKPETLSIDEEGRRHFYKHELLSEEITKSVMPKLTFSKEQTKQVANLVRNHMRPLQCGPAAVRRIMRDTGELFDLWIEIKKADAPPKQPQSDFEKDLNNFLELKNKEDVRLIQSQRSGLAIDGQDLIKLGFKPGPEMGDVLTKLENTILDDPGKNTKEILLAIAKGLL
jgi:tRNA nucleotidyltransferase/poly(A) polymerase